MVVTTGQWPLIGLTKNNTLTPSKGYQYWLTLCDSGVCQCIHMYILAQCTDRYAVQWLELKVSFWAAFLLPLCFWVLPVGALVVGRGRYGKRQFIVHVGVVLIDYF